MEKVLKAIMVLAIIVLVGIILVTIDYSRILHIGKPIFSIQNPAGVYKDGGTVEYFGLGYKIIDFNTLNGYDKIKVGTWFMQYSDFQKEIENNNMSATMKAVVVKVNEKNLAVMELEGTNGLLYVGLQNAGDMVFKPGQEILIYFDGIVLTTYPGQLSNVGKIEIVKEKSDVEISEEVFRTFYSSSNNVKVSVSKLTSTGIAVVITDTNQYPYNYANTYTIYKKNKQVENLTLQPIQTEPATSNSVPPYMGTGQVLWEEAKKISNEYVPYTVKEWNKGNEIGRICDWTSIYGELGVRRI